MEASCPSKSDAAVMKRGRKFVAAVEPVEEVGLRRVFMIQVPNRECSVFSECDSGSV